MAATLRRRAALSAGCQSGRKSRIAIRALQRTTPEPAIDHHPEHASSMNLPAHAFPPLPAASGTAGWAASWPSPLAFARLYGGADAARLYAPPPPPGEVFPLGSELTLRLTLFGAAGEHALACTQALLELGERGLDPAGRYRLLRASVVQPAGEQLFYCADAGLCQPPATGGLGDWLRAAPPADELEIRLRTPLCCKQGNALLRSAPEYAPLPCIGRR